MAQFSDVEAQRLRTSAEEASEWRRWGPYLSEREWGTVREDYSPYGTAWEYFTHDQARSRAYRWGEDGLAGFCDDNQFLCISLALWNGKDPILKERLFGLTNAEGNHGEDVKEIYYYLDAVPSYAYARMLYKLPQSAYPYDWLVAENGRRRGQNMPEFELIDTGVFDQNRYFDVQVEYAKADADDILMRITVFNRGPEEAPIDILPQVWFRNTWSWYDEIEKPRLEEWGSGLVGLRHMHLARRHIAFDRPDELLFCENETNFPRIFGYDSGTKFPKDSFHRYIADGQADAVNPHLSGTKVAGRYHHVVPPGGSVTVRVRTRLDGSIGDPFQNFDEIVSTRIAEANAFYDELQSKIPDPDMRNVQRQAFAGMLWSKQFYRFDVARWLDGDPTQPPPPEIRKKGRDKDWRHLSAADIISMPDKWEYPWFAAWDLAFHCVTFSLIDPAFAKDQLSLLCRVWMMHPNGELPAYEWAFGDVNPPVQAWAALRIYENEKKVNEGIGDIEFLRRMFDKLLLNFTWWVNRKDENGLNIFEGGFLGLDNIGVFDRSAPLPTGGYISQSDGTAWMAMYCLNMQRIAVELAQNDPIYEEMVVKFFEHFLYIARAMTDMGSEKIGLWDDQDQFYYDVLNMPSGEKMPIRLRSMVGLVPLFAVELIDQEAVRNMPNFAGKLEWYWGRRADLSQLVLLWRDEAKNGKRLLSLARGPRIVHILHRMLDESEFFSPYGIRALSRYYLDHPYDFQYNGMHYVVKYLPAESNSGLFGGNSNWRGPVWMPMNYMIATSLGRFYDYFGDDLKVECPTGSGNMKTLEEVSDELCLRLISLFTRGKDGRRPVLGAYEKLQNDPFFRDYIPFYEYFDGDNGRGVGASHQTGWTGLVANLINHLAVNDRLTRPAPAEAALVPETVAP